MDRLQDLPARSPATPKMPASSVPLLIRPALVRVNDAAIVPVVTSIDVMPTNA
jgi:hypothetical protein